MPPRDALTIRSRSPFEGAEVMNMSPAVAEELSLDGALHGVVVASVGDNSTAAEVGVQKGDIVVVVNGQQIGTTRDLEKACAERARLWDLTIHRGGETNSLPARRLIGDKKKGRAPGSVLPIGASGGRKAARALLLKRAEPGSLRSHAALRAGCRTLPRARRRLMDCQRPRISSAAAP